MNVLGFVKNQITASDLIEKEYIDPSEANIVFPEKKQNLIYIYLESMENTFSSKEDGGMYEESRIPELTEIAKNNIETICIISEIILNNFCIFLLSI